MTSDSKRLEQLAKGIMPVNPVLGDDVRWTIEDRLALYNCPGVAVCLIEDGKVADAAGFGHVEVGGVAVEAQTMFAGASISKPVTASLALQLVEQGLIDLDAPINRYLTTWNIPENDFTRAKPVTLRHLLCHRAGTTVHGFGAYPQDQVAPTLLQMLRGQAPSLTPAVIVDKEPGGTERYSGGGTQIVQLLLEELTGLPFADLAQKRIFEPLGMTRTTFEQPLPDRFRNLSAVGHLADGNPVKGRQTFTPQLAAGGIYTSAPDYARFMVETRNAWLGQTNLLMNRATAAAMMTPQGEGAFGLGWEIFGQGKAKRFGHGGSNEGFQCNTVCLLEQGRGGVVLTNALMGILLYYEMLNAMADIYEWQGYLREPKVIQTLSEARQNLYVGRYSIVAGIDLPHMDIWVEDGQLMSDTPGLIFPPRAIFLGQNDRFFNQQTPSETAVAYGADGRAETLTVYASGDVQILKAVRQSDKVA